MKKTTLLLLAASVIVCACKYNKNNTGEDLNYETEEVISMAMDNPNFSKTPAEEPEKVDEDLSGKIIFLDDETFVSHVTDIDNPKGFQFKGQTPCLVDFYADWCRPCSALHPILVELAQEYKGELIVYKVNTDKCGVTAQAFNVISIPTMILFKRNAQPVIINGAMPKAELKAAIDKYLSK